MRAKKSRIFLIVVERPSRLPCRYSYWHSSQNVGKDADVATGVPSGSARSAGARLQGPAPGAMERDGPRRGGDQHDQADGNREGARGGAEINGDAGQITAGGHNQHADAGNGAEDSAAEAVCGVDLEERAGEDPVGGASGVRGNHGADGDGERSGGAEADIPGGGDHEAGEDAGAQAGGAFARPAGADQGTEEGACAARAHQHAHAEVGGAAVVQAGDFHRENALAVDGEQYVVGAEQTESAFDEDGAEEADSVCSAPTMY